MQSVVSKDSKLSTTHQAIAFFDDAEQTNANLEYLGHEPESYLIAGHPGSGKSTLAGTFPEPYFLNFDRKSGAIAGKKIKTFEHGSNVMRDVSMILDALADLKTKKELGIKTIVIDTLSSLSELMEVWCVNSPELNPKKTKGLLIQHYSIIQHDIVEIIRRGYEAGVDMVFTCHLDEIQDEEGELVYHPAITGKKGGPKLGGKMDNVILMERNENGFVSTLKGIPRFPHAKLAVSPFIYKEMPDRIADLTYKKLVAIKAGKAKKKNK